MYCKNCSKNTFKKMTPPPCATFVASLWKDLESTYTATSGTLSYTVACTQHLFVVLHHQTHISCHLHEQKNAEKGKLKLHMKCF